MLARDSFGYIHDIPDAARFSQPSQVLYDGLGNPVGHLGDFFDFLKPVVGAITNPIGAITQAASNILPAVGQVASSVLPAVGNLLNPLQAIGNIVGGLLPGQAPQPAQPAPGFVPPPGMPFPFPGAPGFMPPVMPPTPWPLGWQSPTVPYTGLGPQRMYMRCAVWPGPAGLVPTAPGPGQAIPPAPPSGPPAYPGYPSYPSYPSWGGGRGRRQHRHRRR
jgi:hypothetical protein